VPDEPTGPDLARDALARARADAAARRREHEGATAARRRADIRAANATPRRSASADGDPQPFGAAIEELLADRGWTAEATVAAVTANWAQTVGEDLAAHCTPVSLSGGVLTVEAESTAWATQIRLLQRHLLERIAAIAGTGVVRRLVVVGPTGPSWQHGRLRVRGRGPRDTYG
jgi:predicted nucleic acid-binding Zn ribbon protein